MNNAVRVHRKSRAWRAAMKRLERGTEPGLYALVTGPITYDRCRCELGCKCSETNR